MENFQTDQDSPMVQKRWYVSLFENIKAYSSQNPIFFLFLLLMLPITLFAVESTLSLFSKATNTNSVNLAFSPSTLNLSTNSNIKIMMESQNGGVGFARVVYAFDNTKIKLTSEITTNPLFSTVIEKTTMAQANSNGTVKIVVALPPGAQAPIGNFEFAAFAIDVNNANTSPTQVSFTPTDIQVVNLTQIVLSPTVTDLNINQPDVSVTTASSISATLIPSNIPSPSSSASPSATSVPASPSASVVPSTTIVPSTAVSPSPTSPPLPWSSPYPGDPRMAGKVGVTFLDPFISLPPDRTVKILLDAPLRKVAFARIDFTFDQTKVNLTGEIRTNPNFSTVVQKTSMHAANIAGKVSLVIAASPSDTSPEGMFVFAEIPIKALSSNIGKTSIDIDSSTIQIVDKMGNILTPLIDNLRINDPSGTLGSPTPSVPITYGNPPNFKLELENPSAQIKAGDTFNVKILINTAGIETINADAVLKYSNSKLAVNSVQKGNFNTYFYSQAAYQFNNPQQDEKKYIISGWEERVADAKKTTTDVLFATVSLTAKVEGVASLDFDCIPNSESDSNINRSLDSKDIINCPLAPLNLNIIKSTGEIAVKFSASSVNLPPASTVKIILDSLDKKVVFTKVEFTFDKSKVNLTGEIKTNPNLSTIISKTSMHEANINGKALVIIAASPSDTAPSGQFDFVELSLNATSANIGKSSVIINPANIQIVDSRAQILTPKITNLGINGEIVVSPSPTPYTSNPNACTVITAPTCLLQWAKEYARIINTKVADLNQNGRVELMDFEIIRKALFP